MIRALLAILAIPDLALAQVDRAKAEQYFNEIQRACEKDGGAMWGVSLCGPVLLVDMKTFDAVANQADAKGQLTQEGKVFIGTLPKTQTVANTAMEWSGTRWSVVVWQFIPADPAARIMLFMHEAFHRIQDGIGLTAQSSSNPHLDSPEGRILLQLEWRALEKALTLTGDLRKPAVVDALTFRAARRARFKDAAANENSLESNEGLAEYTAVRVVKPTVEERIQTAISDLHNAAKKDTFVRSFAYGSGPAYGMLLDAAAPEWRRTLPPDADLGAILGMALTLTLPPHIEEAAEARSKDYDGAALRAAEHERDAARQKRIAEYRARLVDGATLKLPLEKPSFEFNPNNLVPFDNAATIYPTLRLVDTWGILQVTNGALMDRKTVSVPAPKKMTDRDGDGWKLELKPGWSITPGARPGDWVIQKTSPSN